LTISWSAEPPLSVCVVVAERQQLLVPPLQRLEPGQPFVDRDLCHVFTCASMPSTSEDDDGIVVETLSNGTSGVQ
jgi:hypothetical protein